MEKICWNLFWFCWYVEFGKTYNHINKLSKISTEKWIINKISKRLSELKFESNHSIKWKCLKYVVRKISPSL